MTRPKEIDDGLDELTPVQEYWHQLYSRWEAAYIKGRGKGSRIPPSEAKFFKYLGVSSAVGNTWMEGRNKMSLQSCLEVAINMWDIASKGGVFRNYDVQRMFEVNGFDPVIPVRDDKLREIALEYWEDLTDADKEELADYAQRLYSGQSAEPARVSNSNGRRLSADNPDDMAETPGQTTVAAVPKGAAAD